MSKVRTTAIAMTIAGSDSGGGAGIQADLNTFAALAVHGTTAITSLTAQNPTGVRAIQPAEPRMVRQQIEAVFDELPPHACKTGMLYSAGIIQTVAELFSASNRPPLVVDPVMIATSGARLIKPAAVSAMLKTLLPLATLVTPNLPETEMLLKRTIPDEEAMRLAAKEIHERFGCAALIKGGHLPGATVAVDIYFDGREELLLSAPMIKNLSLHGTGCTYAAAVTACLALGRPLPEAVGQAKQFITHAIAQSRLVGAHRVLGWFAPGNKSGAINR